MLENIIRKLCNYLGDNYGFDYDDLMHSCNLSQYEIECIREIVEDEE